MQPKEAAGLQTSLPFIQNKLEGEKKIADMMMMMMKISTFYVF
jgi:hypothetical protein